MNPLGLGGFTKLPFKRCPQCEETNLEAFGVDRSRRDGLTVCCRLCMKRARPEPRRWRRPSENCRKGDPARRVLKAITYGARTQDRIKQRTGLNQDEVADAIAVLMLDRKQIRREPLTTMGEWGGQNWRYDTNILELR